MKPHSRYEIIGPLAKGDYATVYRALDRELNREVAIKQIHQQYLEDPQQLDRYWQEAQLLARLEHPRIMTIYDIVRERGWLVLELMQGSLSQIQNGAPIDLNVLRMGLTCGLSALHFLQQNGIIHGDVKPSNLLVDKNNRIKLGDFGIARRMTGDPGSIIKGTTKYMAPEVLSDQFGDVGPHSDLYSLGFSAYELMCGSRFDSLFPGLDMFGRDRQMAWMMWHSSPDRRLPEIQRVLQGVPDDLRFVIQKLTEKDPAKRYRTAEEVLHDLTALGKGAAPGPSQEEVEKAAALARQAKRKRLLTFAALGVSVALSLVVLFFPTGSKTDPNAVKARLEAGVLKHVTPEDGVLHVTPAEGGQAKGIRFNRELDSVLLNDRKVDLADLEPGDEIKIKYFRSQDNRPAKEISATRAMAVVNTGQIVHVDTASSTVTLAAGDRGETLEVHVPPACKLLFNADARLGNRPVELADLKTGDQVVASHVAQGNARAAVSLHVTRRVTFEGFVVSVDAAAGKLVVRDGEQPASPRKTLTVSADCEVSLNGASALDGRSISLAELRENDKVQLEHDARVSKIAAYRVFTVEGEVQGTPDAASFVVKLSGQESPVKFTLASRCRIELAGTNIPIDLAYLRPGDLAKVSHSSPDLKNPLATAVVVEALPDKRAWAVVLIQQHYDDPRLPEIGYASADGKLLRETLAGRYRVPGDQLLYHEDASRLRLEQDLDQFLKRVPPRSQLVVYYSGHAFLSPKRVAYLAPQEFDSTKLEITGWSLRSLLTQLEACAASDKILLLDTCHAADQPASDEVVKSLRMPGGTKVSSTVTIIASCSVGESGAIVERSEQPHSALASSVDEAFQGRADANRDQRVDAAELFTYLSTQILSLAARTGKPQTPTRYLPDATPERITAGGKNAIRKLLAHMSATRFDPIAVTNDFVNARELVPDQPEAMLAYGLVLLKHSKGADAMAQFEAVRAEHPKAPLAHHALAWQHFGQGNSQAGAADLAQLVASLPRPEKQGAWNEYAVHCLSLAGTLRQFAFKAAATRLNEAQLAPLDEQIRSLDPVARAHCTEGVREVEAQLKKLDKQIDAAEGADKRPLEFKRRTASTYASFDFLLAAQHLRDALEK